MKPVFFPHTAYQNFVIEQLQKHYSGGILTLVRKDWPVISELWIPDLSEMTIKLRDVYGARGPEPRDPASTMQSSLFVI